MAAPKVTKRKFSPGRTAAIQASREATKAQTAPGVEYKKERAAKKAAGGGYFTSSASQRKKAKTEEEKRKRKERMAKMKSITAEAKQRRQARSPMPTFGAR